MAIDSRGQTPSLSFARPEGKGPGSARLAWQSTCLATMEAVRNHSVTDIVLLFFFLLQSSDQGSEEIRISNGTNSVNGHSSVTGPEDGQEEGSSECVNGNFCCVLVIENKVTFANESIFIFSVVAVAGRRGSLLHSSIWMN